MTRTADKASTAHADARQQRLPLRQAFLSAVDPLTIAGSPTKCCVACALLAHGLIEAGSRRAEDIHGRKT